MITHFQLEKTTAIWLLQENERVSSDRLFRVRDKQPYSGSSLTLAPVTIAAPLVSNVVHVGDLCVFKFGLNWQLGRILQFSKYDTENKKYSKSCNDQSVEVSKHVGVLCTWYEQNSDKIFELSKNGAMEYQSLENYMCTVPGNCINVSVGNPDGTIILNSITKSLKQSCLTAKQFSIKEEYMKSLLSMVDVSNPSKIQQKHGEGSSATNSIIAKATDAILIPDNNENEHEATSAKDL